MGRPGWMGNTDGNFWHPFLCHGNHSSTIHCRFQSIHVIFDIHSYVMVITVLQYIADINLYTCNFYFHSHVMVITTLKYIADTNLCTHAIFDVHSHVTAITTLKYIADTNLCTHAIFDIHSYAMAITTLKYITNIYLYKVINYNHNRYILTYMYAHSHNYEIHIRSLFHFRATPSCRNATGEVLLLQFRAALIYLGSRVTRWVCKKIAQNVAQPIFLSKRIHNLYRGKSSPRNYATFVVFKKLPKRKQPPNRRKFAQSGRSPCLAVTENYAQTHVGNLWMQYATFLLPSMSTLCCHKTRGGSGLIFWARVGLGLHTLGSSSFGLEKFNK
jgi:hypothetical protein